MQPRLRCLLLLKQSLVATGAVFISRSSPLTPHLSRSNGVNNHRFAHNNNINSNNNGGGGGEVDGDDVEYRSISDYVGGLHAGKYDFDTRISGVTSLNYEKSQVFDDATRSKQKGQRSILAPYEESEHFPAWATRKLNKYHPMGTIHFNSDVSQASVTIGNEELSWEPFFAAIEYHWDDQPTSISSDDVYIVPSNGTLAPRGGVDVYSDVWDLVVSRPDDIVRGGGLPNLYLVVRTEMDAWVWNIDKN